MGKKMYITEKINIKNCLPPRIEPGHSVFRDLCVSTWPPRHSIISEGKNKPFIP